MLKNSLALVALLSCCVAVALSTSVTIMLDIESGTMFWVALGYITLGIGYVIGLDAASGTDWRIWPLFVFVVVLTFFVPAGIIYISTRSYFRGVLSLSLIVVWLLFFLGLYWVGPDFSGP